MTPTKGLEVLYVPEKGSPVSAVVHEVHGGTVTLALDKNINTLAIATYSLEGEPGTFHLPGDKPKGKSGSDKPAAAAAGK